MIRTIRKYRRSMLGILGVAGAALIMTSFGVNFSHTSTERFAVTVDDITVPYDRFHEEKRDIENRYRQMLGANYDKLAESLNLNIPQTTMDKLINDTLITRDAEARGFSVGDEQLRQILLSQFPSGFDAQAFNNFLQYSNMTEEQFLGKLRSELLREQYTTVLMDASVASAREAKALYKTLESSYSVQTVEFDPASFIKSAKEPSAETIESYYKENGQDFEIPSRVSYDYLLFTPEKFSTEVEISAEDVDLYYTDNQSKFEKPESFKLRHIQFNYPKESDPAKMADVRDRAQKTWEKAKTGEDFGALVQQFTEDFSTRVTGGDLGWVSKGRFPASFDAAVEKAKGGGIADLIETDYGFHVVKVESYKDKELRPLEEVRGEIEKALREENAPAFAVGKAQEFFEKWSRGDSSLAEAPERGSLEVLSSKGLLDESKDPDPSVTGLTKKILETPGEAKQFIELKDSIAVVSIKDFKESEIPPLDAVKEKITRILKENESRTLAQNAGKDLIEKMRAKPNSRLDVAAKEAKLTVQKKSDIKKSKGGDGIFADREIARSLFSVSAANNTPSKVFGHAGKYYVWQVETITEPDMSKATDKIYQYRLQATRESGQQLASSIIGKMKAASKIVPDATLLVE